MTIGFIGRTYTEGSYIKEVTRNRDDFLLQTSMEEVICIR